MSTVTRVYSQLTNLFLTYDLLTITETFFFSLNDHYHIKKITLPILYKNKNLFVWNNNNVNLSEFKMKLCIITVLKMLYFISVLIAGFFRKQQCFDISN